MAQNVLTSKEKFHIKLGLGRIERILELLHNPQDGMKFIHIAGTNGKGSVCAILEEILTTAGFKTGKFTSPHLFSYCERICVDKKPASEAWLDNTVKLINELDKKHNIGLTEFEILTAAGFLYFKQKECDIAIIEVGLGGRLDSTNVIKNPLACVITSISLEHTERLGGTIEAIAGEKAGIIKKGCPVVFLKENRGYETIKTQAESKGGVIYEAKKIDIKRKDGENFINSGGKEVKFALNGRFQGENAALAIKTVKLLDEKGVLGRKIGDRAVETALGQVKWRFRLEETEINGGKVLIDACHNPDGARVLREYTDENYKDKRIKFIFGCLKNKDYKSVLENLLTVENSAGKRVLDPNKTLCFFEYEHKDSLHFDELPLEFKRVAKRVTDPISEIENNKNWDLTVVCGSIYMLGQIFEND